MKNQKLTSGCLLLTAAVFALCNSACSTGGAGKTSAPYSPDTYYKEIVHAEKIYVVGSVISYSRFVRERKLAGQQEHKNVGPSKKTVIVEADKANPELQKRLWERYVQQHLYYAQEEYKGRIYVLGTLASHDAFKKSHKLRKSRVLPAKDPDDKEVLIEVAPQDPSLSERLEAEFAKRNPPAKK